MLASFEYLQSDARARVGTVVQKRWSLQRLLGVGGLAAVYEATDPEGRSRALKIVHQKLLEDEKVFRRLRREAEVVKRLAHPGIVTVHDVCRDEDGSLFLVMDLLQGHSFDVVRRAVGGMLSSQDVRWAASELLHVLVTAHGQGVLHRDIKPSNIFLTNDGALKVLDFGVARSRGTEGSGAASMQTLEGSVLGTPTFMSPEQARGRWSEVDERSDLWSVGATLFTLASGRPVHEARNATEALGLAMTAQARSLAEVCPSLDADLVQIIDRSLRYKARDRFSNARQMFEALGAEPSRAAR
jgi:serine/threonine-protein kinase